LRGHIPNKINQGVNKFTKIESVVGPLLLTPTLAG